MRKCVEILLLIYIPFAFVCCSDNGLEVPVLSSSEVEVEIFTRAFSLLEGQDVEGEHAVNNLWLIVYDDATGIIEYSEDVLYIAYDSLYYVLRNLSTDLTPGPKEFFAIGNLPNEWVGNLENKAGGLTPTSTDLKSMIWEESKGHLPQLKKDAGGKYIKNKGRFVIDENFPMRYSGYIRDTLIADTFNSIRVPIYRNVGKLEIEFVPDWDKTVYDSDELDLLDGVTGNPIAISVKNRATESLLFQEDKYKDPVNDHSLGINTTLDMVTVGDEAGGLKLAYETSTTKMKTVKTVPVYFFENHPDFDELQTPPKWMHDDAKHPLIDITITTKLGPYHAENLIPFAGKLIENNSEVSGIHRNHYYHLKVKLFINPFGKWINLNVQPWTEIESGGIPPLEIQ
ncbi:hypothetical protein [Bacteroides sp. 519]|uniref:hypothetical protein n=1 Tax=Bacteroides sp. 519 TaxID=2302937 RepID=UPI0013D4B5B7|nr:hypothetical protein [Bacteroides sp. 519]NDV59530.1 hypothetical protein [Bacteroides sp. 519]